MDKSLGEVRACQGSASHAESRRVEKPYFLVHDNHSGVEASVLPCARAAECSVIPASNADFCQAEWLWDLFFQVAAEEAGSAPRGDECSNFPISFWQVKLSWVMLREFKHPNT